MHTLRRLTPERQTAVLLAGIKLLPIQLRDTILDMFEQWTDESIMQSKQSLRDERLRTLATYDQAARYLRDLAQQVVAASPKTTVGDLLTTFVADEIKAAIAVVDSIQQPRQRTYHGYLTGRYRSARFFLSQLLRLMPFEGLTETDDVLTALHFMHHLNTDRLADLQNAPQAVISSSWRALVVARMVSNSSLTRCV